MVAALAASGCNQLLGIRETTLYIDAAPGVDEDGDNVLNDVDNCPGIYNPTQDDSDGDNVGDVCDPHPSTPGDHIAFTEFFEGNTFAVTPGVGTWMLGNGALTSVGPADGTDASVMLSKHAPSPTLEAGFTVVDYGAAAVDNAIDMTIAFPGNSGLCELKSYQAGDALAEVVALVVAVSSQNVTNLMTPLAENVGFTFQMTRNANADGRCVVSGTTTVLDVGPGSNFSDAMVTIEVRRAQVALRYVVLYDVP